MERDLYRELMTAKKSGRIDLLKELYENHMDNVMIKFEYAKKLKAIDLNLAKKLLNELLGTSNENYALIELGIIEKSIGNYDLASLYFNKVLNNDKASDNDKNCAKLELGKINVSMGNNNRARQYYNELVGTANECYALLELGKLEFKAGNSDMARESFEKVVNSKCGAYAMLWLGRIETIQGNNLNAMLYFNELLKTPLKRLADIEIEKVRIKQSKSGKCLRKI